VDIWLLIAAAGSVVLGAAHLGARRAGRATAALVLKPLPVLLALLVAWLSGSFLPSPVAEGYRGLIAAGLLVSMAGDLFLALPRDRFIPGLLSFLVAHLLYIAAFFSREGFHAAPVALIVALIYGGLMLALLLPGLRGALRPAVFLYMAVILVMGWQATGLWLALRDRAAALAAAGAILFVISDSVLAWDRFRKPLRHGALLVMGSYYAAQWLLALSVIDWGV